MSYRPSYVPYSPNQFLGWDFFANSYNKTALVTILKALVESKVCNSTIRMDTNLQIPGWRLKYSIICSRTAFERNCQMHILLSGTIVSVLLSRSILISKKRCSLSFLIPHFQMSTLLKLHCKPIPCNENRVFPVNFFSQGKPCSGPVLALYGIAVWMSLSSVNE